MRTLLLCLSIGALAYAQTPTPPSPPHTVLRGGRTVISRSAAKRGYLGVGVVEVASERVKALKLPDDSGVEVKRVDENSPASKAGLRENDVILEVNAQKIEDVDQFIRAIGDAAPGSKVDLTVWRSGAKQTLTATLTARPAGYYTLMVPEGDMAVPMPPMPPMPNMPDMPNWSVLTGQAPRVGFEGETLTPQLADYFGVKEGVLVRTVQPGTPAAKAGLKAGDVVIKVGGTPVSSTREISGLVRAARGSVTFTVMRNHKETTLNMELAEDRGPGPQREVL